jgi:hypothetical protein
LTPRRLRPSPRPHPPAHDRSMSPSRVQRHQCITHPERISFAPRGRASASPSAVVVEGVVTASGALWTFWRCLCVAFAVAFAVARSCGDAQR